LPDFNGGSIIRPFDRLVISAGPIQHPMFMMQCSHGFAVLPFVALLRLMPSNPGRVLGHFRRTLRPTFH
jgi:hypothetical protein